MRHFGFIALMLLALVIAAPTALVLAMNECQVQSDQAATNACFQSVSYKAKLWDATILGPLVAAVALHILDSKWKFAALGALAIGPWLVLME